MGNPTWDVNFSTLGAEFLQYSRITVKLWNCTCSPHSCILETKIRLNRYGYVGSHMEFVEIPIQNLLVLELHDGLYVKEEIAAAHAQSLRKPDIVPITCPSYTRAQFHTILKVKQKILKAKERNNQLKHNLQGKIAKHRQLLEKKQRCNLLSQLIQKLKSEIEEEKNIRQKRIEELKNLHNSVAPVAAVISKALFDILESKQQLQLQIRNLNESKNQLYEFFLALEGRQTYLIRELRAIFSITPAADQHQSLCINTIRLPNTDYTGCSEEGIATALGLVCQVIFMLSRWLNVPLRYPMTPASSRSVIIDRISSVYGPIATFPLYSRGVDRNRFEFGVFLLNKNLEQLMNSQNLDIITLRHTLPNLHLLLISRGKGLKRRKGITQTNLAEECKS